MKKIKNICDECGTELEKTFILTEFNIPFVGWICPKSEYYQFYKKEYKKKYEKKQSKAHAFR